MACPNRQELSDFHIGKLPAASRDQVAGHVMNCGACQATLASLSGKEDTSVDGVKKPRSTSSTGEPSTIGRGAQAPQVTVDLQTFAQAVVDLGLADAQELTQLVGRLPADKRTDPTTLARTLIELAKLTKFQAQNLLQGRARGLRFGDYLVLDGIGSGGMGHVYRARHRRMDRVVALKVLAAASLKNAESVARFQREVRAAAKLMHPNIVTAFDAGDQDGVHYLVMEYVDGPDLASLVKKRGPLGEAAALDYVQQAARGFAFAHSKGIVHRDIKPGNLLVASDGAVKILDLGLARLNDHSDEADAQARDELTQGGQVMGTLDYMAPEQALNTSRADAKSDVYSLGCTLYRIVCGENVYGGTTVVEKILAHREQPIPSIRRLRPEIAPSVDALISRMVAKRPADRPTMNEVVEAVEAIKRGGTIAAPATFDPSLPPSVAPLSASPVYATAVPPGAASIPTAAPSGPGAIGASPRVHVSAVRRRSRGNGGAVAALFGLSAAVVAAAAWIYLKNDDRVDGPTAAGIANNAGPAPSATPAPAPTSVASSGRPAATAVSSIVSPTLSPPKSTPTAAPTAVVVAALPAGPASTTVAGSTMPAAVPDASLAAGPTLAGSSAVPSRWPIPPSLDVSGTYRFNTGLSAVIYRRADTTPVPNEELVEPSSLGAPVFGPEVRAVVRSLDGWKTPPDCSAVVSGYLRVDERGEYAFSCTGEYDRTLLFVDGRPMGTFRDLDTRDLTNTPHRLTIRKPVVSILCVAYYYPKRPQTLSVQWRRPGATEFEPIPSNLLYHQPKLESTDVAAAGPSSSAPSSGMPSSSGLSSGEPSSPASAMPTSPAPGAVASATGAEAPFMPVPFTIGGSAPGRTTIVPGLGVAGPAAPSPTGLASITMFSSFEFTRSQPAERFPDRQVPAYLAQSAALQYVVTRGKVDSRTGMAEFRVTRPGKLYLAACFETDGRLELNESAERYDDAKLRNEGWNPVETKTLRLDVLPPGTSPVDAPHTIYERACVQGDLFRIRTRKYAPPVLFVAPDDVPTTNPLAAAPPRASDPSLIVGALQTGAMPADVVAGAITFRGPKGDRGDGANGLAVDVPHDYKTEGTQWRFKCTMQGDSGGVHLVHPHGAGHLRVQITKSRIDLFVNGTWGTAPKIYTSGSSYPISSNSSAAKLFPLSEQVSHVVVSKLDKAGSYELTLDGTWVVRAKIAGARPLRMIPPFTDTAAPPTLNAGQAALVIGPSFGLVNHVGEARLEPAGTLFPQGNVERSTAPTTTVAGTTPRSIAQWILSLGGTVTSVNSTGKSTYVRAGQALPDDVVTIVELRLLDQSTFTDADLAVVATLKDLRLLEIHNSRITGSGFEHLKNLTQLASVSFGYNPLKEEYLQHLAAFPALTRVALSKTKVGDAGIAVFHGNPRIQELWLLGTLITDASMPTIASLGRLETLSLNSTAITDEALPTISTMKKLSYLNLSSTAVTDAGIIALRNMSALEVLHISNTRVSDQSISTLAQLAKLRSVECKNSLISRAAATAVHQQIPRINFYY